jgi:hypothetical protein
MKPQRVTVKGRWRWRALTWSAFVAITFLLAAVVQALASSAFVAPGPSGLTDIVAQHWQQMTMYAKVSSLTPAGENY